MKNFIYIFCVLLFSCKSNNNNLIVEQTQSIRDTYIRPDIYSSTRDSLKMEIPLELYIKNDTDKNFDFLEFHLIYNKKYISEMNDFYITDMENRKISRFGIKLRKNDSLRIVLKTLSSYISLNDTKEVFKKYLRSIL